MASTMTIHCPECDKPLKAPSDAAGKKIRCKACGATFPTPAPKAEKAAKEKAKKGGPEEEEVKAYTMREEYLGRRCPDCANALEEEDRICLHCGYDTVTRERARMKKVRETTGGDVVLWLIPGILCAIMVLVVITLLTLLWIYFRVENLNPDAWYNSAGLVLCTKIYLTLMGLFMLFYGGRFAIRRLILHPMPPEIEEKQHVTDE